LDSRPKLSHVEQRAYATLWSARGDAELVPAHIDDAVATLRDPKHAFDPDAYDHAIAIIEAAQRAISAAYAPLELSFSAYRTPFSLLTPEEIAADAAPDRDPFHDYALALGERLRAAKVDLVGLSIVFPGQMQPAFGLAHKLRAALGEAVHLT